MDARRGDRVTDSSIRLEISDSARGVKMIPLTIEATERLKDCLVAYLDNHFEAMVSWTLGEREPGIWSDTDPLR